MGNRGAAMRALIFIAVLVAFITVEPPPQAAAQGSNFVPRVWSIEAVDAPIGAHQASMMIDSSGDPHVALGSDALYYASLNEGGEWELELVDDMPGAGTSPSLAFDAQGFPHIAYAVTYASETRYAYWNGTHWVIQTVSSTETSMTSLVLDASDHPHIAMANGAGLQHAQWTGSQWSVETVSTCPIGTSQALYPSIAAAPGGTLHLSYTCNGAGLWYASWNGISWQTSSIDPFTDASRSSSIALDSAEHPHIAYNAGSSLKYVSWDAAAQGWAGPEVIDTAAYAGNSVLAIDSSDVPHIGYTSADRTLKEAAFNGTTWAIEAVADTANLCGTNAQALDPSGEAHVAYLTCAPAAWQFFYVHQAGDAWSTPQSVNAVSRAGAQGSMVVDGSGNPHISHYDPYQYQVRYTTWNGAEWTTEVVDSISPGQHVYTSIQVDAGAVPHISYFDNLNHLMYASRTSGTWTTTLVPGAGGQYDTLALDLATGYPGIAYCSGGLKYISWDGSAWSTPESVDPHCGSGDMGGENSLAIDSQGNPHISFRYYDGSTSLHHINYATRNGAGTWSTQEIASGIVRGGALVLDSQGRPHVPYARYDYDASEVAIQHAWLDGSAWVSETVTIFPDYHFAWIAMALDANDVPSFAYRRGTDTADPSGYIGWDGTAWVRQEFDPNALLTGVDYTVMALAPDGRPWISYADEASGDLMLARGEMGETISGTARLAGVSINYTDGTPKSATTNANGHYSFIVTDNWAGTVTPSKPGCTFTPARASLDSVTSDQTIPAFAVKCTVSYRSNAAQDGWIAESSETSNKGGLRNNTDALIFMGDFAQKNEQVKGLLSFQTADLPDNAVLTSARLKFKKAGVWGTMPFQTHGLLLVDVRKGAFYGSAVLQNADFQAAPSKSALLTFTNNPVNGWYSKSLPMTGLAYINKAGLTQFRLRFTRDDDNDGNTDLLEAYSGNAAAPNRPVLVIQFHIP